MKAFKSLLITGLLILVVLFSFITLIFPQNNDTENDMINNEENPGNYIVNSLISWVEDNIVAKSEKILSEDFSHVNLINNIGEKYILLASWDKASHVFNTINKLAISNENILWQIKSSLQIAIIKEKTYYHNTALNIYNKILQETEDEYIDQRIEILTGLGNVYYNMKDYETSIEYYENGITIINESYDKISPKTKSQLYNNFGKTLIQQGRLTDAMSYLNKAIEELDTLSKNDIIYSKIDNNLGMIHYLNGRYQEAIEYYSNSIMTNIRLVNLYDLIGNYENLGYAKFLNEKYKEAIDNFESSLRISQKIDDKLKTANAYNNLGIVKYHQDKLDESNYYYKKAIDILENMNVKNEDLAKYYVNISLVDQKSGNYESAIDNLTKAVTIEKEIESSYYKRDKKLLEELISIYSNN